MFERMALSFQETLAGAIGSHGSYAANEAKKRYGRGLRHCLHHEIQRRSGVCVSGPQIRRVEKISDARRTTRAGGSLGKVNSSIAGVTIKIYHDAIVAPSRERVGGGEVEGHVVLVAVRGRDDGCLRI